MLFKKFFVILLLSLVSQGFCQSHSNDQISEKIEACSNYYNKSKCTNVALNNPNISVEQINACTKGYSNISEELCIDSLDKDPNISVDRIKACSNFSREGHCIKSLVGKPHLSSAHILACEISFLDGGPNGEAEHGCIDYLAKKPLVVTASHAQACSKLSYKYMTSCLKAVKINPSIKPEHISKCTDGYVGFEEFECVLALAGLTLDENGILSDPVPGQDLSEWKEEE